MDTTGDGTYWAVPEENVLIFGGDPGGKFALHADGSFSFDPSGYFSNLPEGQEVGVTFGYRVTDGREGFGDVDTAVVSVIVSGDDCTLNCANGGLCAPGQADYGVVTTYPYESPIDFLEPWSVNGNHCLCPDGLAGRGCSVPYELCDPDSDDPMAGNFACFRGSECVNLGGNGPKQWACDCSRAEGNAAGWHCEYTASDLCTVNGNSWVCANGGVCSEGEKR